MRVKRQRVFIQSFFCERSEPTRPTNLQILALVIIKTILKIQESVDYENINISKGFQIFFSSKMKKISKSSHETKKKQVQFSHFSDFKNVARRGADTKARSNRIPETSRKSLT